jgi:hypothetical protein
LQVVNGEVRDLSGFDGVDERGESFGEGAALMWGRQAAKQSIDGASDFERLLGNQRGTEMNVDSG